MPIDRSGPEHLDPNEEIEATLRRLRREGRSRQEAVQLLLDVLDVPLAEAKRILLTSDTWAEALDEADPDASGDDASSVPPAPG